MTIDIAIYDINKDFIQDWYKNKSGGNITYAISMMASITMVPAIVVAYWVGEASDWDPVAVASIVRLKDFYGYTNVLNKPAGAPI